MFIIYIYMQLATTTGRGLVATKENPPFLLMSQGRGGGAGGEQGKGKEGGSNNQRLPTSLLG